jgi:hypothetical protein
MGAAWKLSNSEQSVPSLSAIPHAIWMALIGLELLCVLGLIIPALNKRLGRLAPAAAIGIGAEMLMFSVVHLISGSSQHGELIYWLVVASLCAFSAYGRLVLKPIRPQ